MLAPYYDDIDAFITTLSSKINAMIRPLIILNEADIATNYKDICDEIEETVDKYGDRIEATISKDATKMIKLNMYEYLYGISLGIWNVSIIAPRYGILKHNAKIISIVK